MNESGCPTFSSWQGVCPKLLMMPSRAFRSVSLAIASKSTAPEGQPAAKPETHFRNAEKITFSLSLTLISAIVEHIQGFYSFLSSLLVAKDEIDPLMEVTGDVLGFLEGDIGLTSHHVREKLLNRQTADSLGLSCAS